MNKVILLGLDGANWHILEQMLSKNIMPNLQKIIKSGTQGNLESYFPYTSRTSWLSMFTGCNPGKHGIPHHIVGGRPEINTLWELLSISDIPSLVVNNLMIYPPQKIKGVMVTGGFSTPPNSKNYVYPSEIYDEIHNFLPDYIPSLDNNYVEKIKQGDFESAFSELLSYSKKVYELTFHLSQKHDWQLLCSFQDTTDNLHHFFWNKPEYLEKYYGWLDIQLGKFYDLANSQNANMFLVSDHGFGSIDEYFLINTWLHNNGLTKLGSPNEFRKLLAFSKLNRKIVRNILSKLKLKNIASKFIPITLKETIPLESNESNFIEKTSKAFSEAYNEITINTNVSSEYESIRNKIISELLKLERNGKKVVLKAEKRENIFSGDYVERAYDIQLLLNDGFGWSPFTRKTPFIARDELNNSIQAGHRPEGILISTGPDISRNNEISGAKIWDITPTILHLFDQQIPSNIDGQVIKNLFDKNSPFNLNPISYNNDIPTKKSINDNPEYDEDDEEQIRKHLKDMGYI